ncbi:MAG: hypothetical protein IJ542_01560 [Clostridia bacterium]|nr:hypothetical protein [Clostridia bacterium]
MKKLKQFIISIALVFALAIPAFALVGCNMLKSNKNNSSSDQQQEQSGGEEQSQPLTLSRAVSDCETALVNADSELKEDYNKKSKDFSEYNAIQEKLKNFTIPYLPDNPTDEQVKAYDAAMAQKEMLERRLAQIQTSYGAADAEAFKDVLSDWRTTASEIENHYGVNEESQEVPFYKQDYQQFVMQSVSILAYLNAAQAKENTPYSFEDGPGLTVAQYSVSDNKVDLLVEHNGMASLAQFVYNGSHLQTVSLALYGENIRTKEYDENPNLNLGTTIEEPGVSSLASYIITNTEKYLEACLLDFSTNNFYEINLSERYSSEDDYTPVLTDFVNAYNTGKITYDLIDRLYSGSKHIDSYFVIYDIATNNAKYAGTNGDSNADIVTLLRPLKSKISELPAEATELDINWFDVEEISFEVLEEAQNQLENMFGSLELLSMSNYNEQIQFAFTYKYIGVEQKLQKALMVSALDQLIDMLSDEEYVCSDTFVDMVHTIDGRSSCSTSDITESFISQLSQAKQNLEDCDDWDGRTLVYFDPSQTYEDVMEPWEIHLYCNVSNGDVIYIIDDVNFYFSLDSENQVIDAARIYLHEPK